MQTVLVADDEFGILLVLEMVLAEAGYRVITAGNGRQAMELAIADPPDLIVLDWMMPVMDGPAAAVAIRVHPALTATPIVIMSGAPETVLKRQFDDYAGFLHKPFRDTDLLEVVARTVAERN